MRTLAAVFFLGCGSTKPPAVSCRVVQEARGITTTITPSACHAARGAAVEFVVEWVITDAAPATVSLWDRTRMDSPIELTNWDIGERNVRYCDYCSHGGTNAEEMVPVEVALPRGTFTRTLEWPGRQWLGPGDTSPPTPLGAEFPAGSYKLNARLYLSKDDPLLTSATIVVE